MFGGGERRAKLGEGGERRARSGREVPWV